jgi:hypothetical protein
LELRTKHNRAKTMTNESSAQTTVAAVKQRPQPTPEQREQRNQRDRERRAAKALAKNATKATPTPVVLADDEGTLGQQQARRDQPFQHALSVSLAKQAKERFMRQGQSQQRQIAIREGNARKHSGELA